jgi:hypothetical protein
MIDDCSRISHARHDSHVGIVQAKCARISFKRRKPTQSAGVLHSKQTRPPHLITTVKCQGDLCPAAQGTQWAPTDLVCSQYFRVSLLHRDMIS